MQPPKLSNIRAAIESVTPLHDFVLVRISPRDAGYLSLVLPDKYVNGHMEPGLKRGVAVAIGRGDRFTTTHKGSRKRFEGDRMPMHVKPGDEVLWTRTPANMVVIEGDAYVFVHEELIFGVLEQEAA